jgi:hypothetical protein
MTDDENVTPTAVQEDGGMAAYPMDRLAKIYRRMAAKMADLTHAYDAEIAGIKLQQDSIKIALKDQMLASGVSSVRTAEGTVILGTKTRYSTTDWDSFNKFVLANDALDLYEKRISQTNMAKFLTDNLGLMPEGLNSNTEYSISVRKPTA